MSAKLFINGKIFTSGTATGLGLQKSMLIHDGKVVCVGSETQTKARSEKVGLSVQVPVKVPTLIRNSRMP